MASRRRPSFAPLRLCAALASSWQRAAARGLALAVLAAAALAAGAEGLADAGGRGAGSEGPGKCEPLNLTLVYTAHAEAYEVIHQAMLYVLADSFLFGLRGVGFIDRFVAVAGSFSHLSMLTGLDPKEILYIDVNENQLLMSAAMVSMVKQSTSRAGFLSAFFARPQSAFNLSALDATPVEPYVYMEELAQVPPVPEIVREMFRRILEDGGLKAACAYNTLIQEYTSNPLDGYPLRKGRICDYITVQGVPLIFPLDHSEVSVCSLQLGQGWLASEAAFLAVRDRLQRARVQFLRKDLFTELPDLVSAHHRTVLYTSNVLTLGIPTYKKHMAALSATALQLTTYSKLVEVTCFTPYGFTEFEEGWATGELSGELYKVGVPTKQRSNVDPAQFLALASSRSETGEPALADSACMLHVLMGSGCKELDFFKSLAVGMLSCGRVVVLEHNRESDDFLIARTQGAKDKRWLTLPWLSAQRLHRLLMSLSANMFGPDNGTLMVPVFADCIIGLHDGCRNFIMSLERSTSSGFAREKTSAVELDGFVSGFLDIVDFFIPEGIVRA